MTALRLKDAVSNMSTENEMRSTAYELIRSKSFILGKLKLSSRKESKHYLATKRSMLDPRGSNILASLIFDLLPDTRIDYVGGLELGAVPLIGPLVMLSYNKGRPIPGLIVRKKPKEHGTERLVEGADDLRGKNVVVVDDVTTTGGSAMKSIKALQAEGANVVLIISILDREEGATELYEREGLAFNPLFKASQFLNAR